MSESNLSELSVIALIRGKHESRATLVTLLRKVEKLTQQETGCISYELRVDIMNSDNFYFLGIWDSQSSLDAHNKTTHVLELREAVNTLVESIEVTRLSGV